jgi:alpha-ribazole phosphatase
MKLWLVRHALPLVEAGICYGSTDMAADAQATLQAAAALAAVLPRRLAVASSPLRRCVQLAEALHAARPDLSWRGDARLAEMDFGCWEGVRWSEIDRAEIERWTADFSDHPFGGRESVGQFVTRVGAALDETRNAGRDALWISHAGVIRAARLLAGGIGLPLRADQWPSRSPGFGQCECLSL